MPALGENDNSSRKLLRSSPGKTYWSFGQFPPEKSKGAGI